MKIVQVSAYPPTHMGGSERYCFQLARRLAERGHDVQILTSNLGPNSKPKHLPPGVKVTPCPSLGVLWRVNPLTFALKQLVDTDADVIHAHTYLHSTSNQAALARRITKKPLVIHLHGGLDISPSLESNEMSAKAAIKNCFYDPTLGRWTLRQADAIASVSRRDMLACQERFGVDPARLWYIPNAVDPHFFAASGGPPPNARFVTFIGRLESWKGVDTFVEIAKTVARRNDEVRFLVVGDGSLRRRMMSDCEELNGRMTFLGTVPNKYIPGLLGQTEVLVLPSRTEGLPTVCIEALASGIPVVASRVGGVPEVVRDGVTGYLCEPGDSGGFAERVLKLVSDDSLRERFSWGGKRLVQANYSWAGAVGLVEWMYECITA